MIQNEGNEAKEEDEAKEEGEDEAAMTLETISQASPTSPTGLARTANEHVDSAIFFFSSLASCKKGLVVLSVQPLICGSQVMSIPAHYILASLTHIRNRTCVPLK
jgi:hypothetical protein